MSTSRLSAFRIPGKFTCAFLGTLAIAANIAGCGGYGGGGSSNYPITVSVSPKRGGLTTSQTLPFTATVQNDSANAGVTWSATSAAVRLVLSPKHSERCGYHIHRSGGRGSHDD